MAYIDQAFYNNHSDISIDPSEFEVLNELAQGIIDSITFNLQGYELASLPEDVQEKVKKAVVRQVESLYMSGGSESLTGSAPESATIGKFSYSAGALGGTSKVIVPDIVKLILGPTGLLYRGVAQL